MNPIAIVAMIFEGIAQGAKLITSIVDAARVQLSEAQANALAAIGQLKTDRREAEREMDVRHAEFEQAMKDRMIDKQVTGDIEAVKSAITKLDPNEQSALRYWLLSIEEPASGERPVPGSSER